MKQDDYLDRGMWILGMFCVAIMVWAGDWARAAILVPVGFVVALFVISAVATAVGWLSYLPERCLKRRKGAK